MISLFKKKKISLTPAPRSLNMTVPTERIRTLRFQRMSDSAIIKTLREEGYSPLEVDKAMRESLKEGVSPPTPQNLPPTPDMDLPLPGEPLPEAREGKRFVFPDEEAEIPVPEPPAQFPPMNEDEIEEELPPLKPLPTRETGLEKKFRGKRELEEAVESVVDEKWIEFERKSGDIINKIQSLENKINSMEKFISELQSEKKTELEEIKGMIDNYKNSMTEVTGKMDSVERALKDALTPMMQSLRSLSDTIKVLKEKKK